MSLFGTGLPKMTYTDFEDRITTILFTDEDTVQVEYNFNEPDYLLNKSVITGKKMRIKNGEYHSFKLNILELSQSLFTSLKAANNSEFVYFWPHSDSPINYKVLITKLQPYYMKQHFYYDACKIEMETESYETL